VGSSRIFIQSDCLQVTKILQTEKFLLPHQRWRASLFDDISIRTSRFPSCEFNFCNREANFVADGLLRETDSFPCVWIDDPPSFIVSLLIDDVSIID
jgi:hypothetical protein